MSLINLGDYPAKIRRTLGTSADSNVVRIDRTSRWGNPFKIGSPDPNGNPMDRDQVIILYRAYAEAKLADEPDWLEPLRGKDLACWCFPSPCHGDVILDLLK